MNNTIKILELRNNKFSSEGGLTFLVNLNNNKYIIINSLKRPRRNRPYFKYDDRHLWSLSERHNEEASQNDKNSN